MAISKASLAVTGGPKENPTSISNNAFWFGAAAFLSATLGHDFRLQPIPGNPQAELERQIAEMEANIVKSGYTGGLMSLGKLPLAA